MANKWSLETLLCDAGGAALPALLAHVLVRVSAKAVASMRLQNKQFRAALDPEIIAFMVEYQSAFARAQRGNRYNVVHGIPEPHRSMAGSDPPDATDEQVRERFERETAAHNVAVYDIAYFRQLSSAVFSLDMTQSLIKSTVLAVNDNPRHTNDTVYELGCASVHTYLAMGNNRCQVCNPTGVRCLNTPMSFTRIPCGYANELLLFCSPRCVEAQSVQIDISSAASLVLPSRTPSGIVKNVALFKCILRHIGIGPPFYCQSMWTRMATHRDGQYLRQSMQAMVGMGGRQSPRYWLLPHSALPKQLSLCEALHVSSEKIEMAKRDISRAVDIQQRMDAQMNALRMEKLLGDVDAMISFKCADGVNLSTLKDIDNVYPGVKKTMERILTTCVKPDESIADHHALESSFMSVVLSTISSLVGPLRRQDQSLTGGNCASGHAYCYVTGLCSGDHPGLDLGTIASMVSNPCAFDTQPVGTELAHWRRLVTAMHAFDAFRWNSVKLAWSPTSGQAGGSSDPVPDEGGGGLSWTIKIGGVGENAAIISAQMTPPRFSVEYKGILNECALRLDELDLEAELPPMPSQDSIDALTANAGDKDMANEARNFLEVVAQIMSFHHETRAMGLAFITNFNTPAFIEAVARSGLDVVALAAEVIANGMDEA